MSPWNRRHLLIAGAALGSLSLPAIARAQSRNVIDTLAADTRFNRFLELVGRAGATDQFRGSGPMTVFAPTEAAFNGVAANVLQDLLSQGVGGGPGGGNLAGGSPDMLRLRALIGYHVIPGVVLTSAQLMGDRQYKTVNGAMLRVASDGGKLSAVNPAPGQQAGSFGAPGLNIMPPAVVEQPDIIATNGIIHAVGGVLFP
jgi:uncharacterized surface protein with fasciclin (FAS1) repeats